MKLLKEDKIFYIIKDSILVDFVFINFGSSLTPNWVSASWWLLENKEISYSNSVPTSDKSSIIYF